MSTANSISPFVLVQSSLVPNCGQDTLTHQDP